MTWVAAATALQEMSGNFPNYITLTLCCSKGKEYTDLISVYSEYQNSDFSPTLSEYQKKNPYFELYEYAVRSVRDEKLEIKGYVDNPVRGVCMLWVLYQWWRWYRLPVTDPSDALEKFSQNLLDALSNRAKN